MQATTSPPTFDAPKFAAGASEPSPSIIPNGTAAPGPPPAAAKEPEPVANTPEQPMQQPDIPKAEDSAQPSSAGKVKRSARVKNKPEPQTPPIDPEPEAASTYQDEQHSSRLLLRLQEVLDTNSASCDLTVIGDDGTEARLHSLMARALAPGLEQVCESLQGCVKLPRVSGKVLPPLIRYLYHGDLAVEEGSAADMLSAATFLGIKGAQELCGRFLKSSLAPANVLSRFSIAREHKLDELMASVLSLIDQEFKAVVATSGWMALEKSQVAELLGRETLRVVSEDQVLDALKLWAGIVGDALGADALGRQADYADMLQDTSVLRIDCISKERLAELVTDCKAAATPSLQLERYLQEELLSRLTAKSNPRLRLWQRRAQCMGQRVLKDFGGTLYEGTVTGVELEDGTTKALISVRYDDGDCEDLYEEEADQVLAAARAAGIVAPAAGVKRKSNAGGSSKKKTPGSGAKKAKTSTKGK